MKKTSVSRIKKLPLLLGALLIISVAAYGTRAYFSDSATQQADIQLSLGNLDIKSVDAKPWIYAPVGNKVNNVLLGVGTVKDKLVIDSKNAKNITNVQPGDQFERIFSFTNSGSLEQNVTVKNTVGEGYEDSIFDVKLERVEENGEPSIIQDTATIKNGGFVNYKMTISVNINDTFDGTYNQKNDKALTNSMVFNAIGDNVATENLLKNAVTVTANQVNK